MSDLDSTVRSTSARRRIARQLAPAGLPEGVVVRDWGVVTAVHAASVDVLVRGVTWPNVAHLTSYSPTVDDYVAVDVAIRSDGGDPLVLGTVSTTGA